MASTADAEPGSGPLSFADCVDVETHDLADPGTIERCRAVLDADGALVRRSFFTPVAVERVLSDSLPREGAAFYAGSTHNVYLTPRDPTLPDEHPVNRQVVSSKGLIADDEIPADSPLRVVYEHPDFRRFLCGVLGIDAVHPYADDLSSINVHFASEGRELGWHFDNSSFAVTALFQAPEGGGRFEYVPAVRDSASGDLALDRVAEVLDGRAPVRALDFGPGDLVLFRGRDAIHRVTPTAGATTRVLVVFAFNDTPGVRLSDSALTTFYGRTG
jgi:hypothetical protein